MKFAAKCGAIAVAIYFGLIALAFISPGTGHPSGFALTYLFLSYPSIFFRIAPYFYLLESSTSIGNWALDSIPIVMVAAGIEYFIVGAAIGSLIDSRFRRTWSLPTIVSLVVIGFYLLSFPAIYAVSRIPRVAEQNLDNKDNWVQRKAIRALGDSGSQDAVPPLLKKLRRGKFGGIDQDVVVALTKIGGIKFWVDFKDSTEGIELGIRDWLDLLDALEVANWHSKSLDISSPKDQEDLRNLEAKLAEFNKEKIASREYSSFELLLGILWRNPALRPQYVDLLKENLQSAGGEPNIQIFRFFEALKQRKYLKSNAFCSLRDTWNRETSTKEVEDFVRDFKMEIKSLDLTVSLPGPNRDWGYYRIAVDGNTCVN